MDKSLPVRPSRHAYVADKASWWTIDDELLQFPGAAS
jgi:hypothetical protein